MKQKVFCAFFGILLCFVTLGTVQASASGTTEYIWPTTNHYIASPYGQRGIGFHDGIDIGVNNVTVSACADGTVYQVYTGCQNYNGYTGKTETINGTEYDVGRCSARGKCNPSNDYFRNGYCNDAFGNGVIIKHADGSYTAYAHMSKVTVKQGESVKQGQSIGTSGSTGYSGGPHLHLTIVAPSKLGYWSAVGSKQYRIDPEEALSGEASATVTTGTYDNLTQTSATLRGSFTTIGSRASECGMYIGTSKSSMTKLGSDKVNTYGTSMFYNTGKHGYALTAGTTYYYQAYAKVNGTTYKGEIKSFTTPEEIASISLDRTSLTMKNGVCTQLTATTTPTGQKVTWTSSDTSVATVTSNGGIDTCKAGTTTITAKMSYGGKQYSASCTVTVTPDNKPTDTPTASVSLNRNSLKLDVNAGVCGYLTAAVSPADSDVIWTSSDTSIVTVSNGVVEPVKSGEAIIYASILCDGELYFDTCKVTVTGVSATVTTKGADNISQTSAIVRGEVTVSSGTVTECGMYIGGSTSNMIKLGSDSISKGTTFYYSTSKYGYALTAGTTYYYQAYAIVDGATIWGDVRSFTTEKAVVATTSATVTTKGADNITQTSAIVRGEVTVSSGTVTECGMYIGGSTSNMTKLGSDSISKGTTFYYSTSKYGYNLTAGTTYYYQAYAIVDGTTILGDVKSFETEGVSATVTTKGADNITQTSAIVRGEVTVSSGTVTECGMYIGGSTSNMTKLGSDSISKGTPFYYSTSKYGYALTAGTTYYYQAYAIVDGKTIWGDVKSLTTSAATVFTTMRSATVVNTNGQYLAINNAAAASPEYSTQIGRIPPGGTVTVDTSKTSGSWYWVTYNGVSGYAYGKYLSLN